MIGFSDAHTRIHIYRAIIEGINFTLIDGMKSIERCTGVATKRILVSGGGSPERHDLPDHRRHVRPAGIQGPHV